MQNDYKGRRMDDTSLEIETFFASGSKGNSVVADGNGGFFDRGFYARCGNPADGSFPFFVGPHSNRKKALDAAYGKNRNLVKIARNAAYEDGQYRRSLGKPLLPVPDYNFAGGSEAFKRGYMSEDKALRTGY